MKSEVKYQDVTLEEINVIKRDGRSVKFNSEKIFDALTKAAKKVELTDMSVLSELTDRVVSEIFTRFSENVKIYEIQSIVEQELLESGETQLAEELAKPIQNVGDYRAEIFEAMELIIQGY